MNNPTIVPASYPALESETYRALTSPDLRETEPAPAMSELDQLLEADEAQLEEWARDRERELVENSWRYAQELADRF